MRYIDADALIKKIYPMGIGDGKYTINAKAVKLAIDNAPAADVVPKSEVKWLESEVDRLLLLAEYNHSVLEQEVETAKAEVAREIFAELERLTKETMSADEKCMDDNSILEWRLCCLKDFLYWLAELKKKYTEEKE